MERVCLQNVLHHMLGISPLAKIRRLAAYERAPQPPSGECGPDSAAFGGRARFDEGMVPPKQKRYASRTVFVLDVLRTNQIELCGLAHRIRFGFAAGKITGMPGGAIPAPTGNDFPTYCIPPQSVL